MARAIRIQFPGAMYHVMARGDRREKIVFDDIDRQTFIRTLAAACERSGFRIHAWVLMGNHYHLLLQTPEANLSVGMGWFQNAFTRRINTRHKLWGHLFGDRYKAILVEPGECFHTLLDYIHLNPVRAGLVKEEDGLESYPWSSLTQYISPPKQRPDWLETSMAFSTTGFADTASGRKEFLETLELRIDWRSPGKSGVEIRDGDSGSKLALHSSLRRGWFFGSQEFKERILQAAAAQIGSKAEHKENGYSGEEMRDHSMWEAEKMIQSGLEVLHLRDGDLAGLPKGDRRKALIAACVLERTTVRLDWIAEKLFMGTRSYCCRIVQQLRRERENDRRLIRLQRLVWEKAIKHD